MGSPLSSKKGILVPKFCVQSGSAVKWKIEYKQNKISKAFLYQLVAYAAEADLCNF